ncbi:uncharacterized protein ISCGN_020647 [Ixodes scapularis]
MYSGRSDSRSSCGHPDDQSSEVELSWEQESSSPPSSSCTYSGRSDWWSFCGHPDNQSSEINLSWNAERISAAPLDHTYSCTVLKNSPLGAHIDHSYALPQDAAPAQESSGDVADLESLVSSPSSRNSLSGCAAGPSHKSPGKSRSIDKKKMNAMRAKVRQLQERNKRLQRRL